MIKRVANNLLSNALLLALALTWLLLIFVPILLDSNHTFGMWYENNMLILGLEIAVCIFAVVWAVRGLIIAIRRMRYET